MKVLHLMSGDINSGAGKGVFRLHKGLLEIGVDSTLVQSSKYKKSDDNIIINHFISFVKARLNRYYNRFLLKSKLKHTIFSLGREPFNCFSGIDLNPFDIVHLHWINDSLSLDEISTLIKKYGNKIVFTYRDMWAITGGCHYSLACIGYKHNDCSACPLFSDKKVLKKIEKSFAYKKRLFVNLNVIAISDWMKKEAVKSNIFSAEQITRIYNSVDISIFYPRAMDLKEKYCINNDKPIVLAGAQNLSHIYKGGEIIAKLFKQYKHDVNFVFFGNGINTIVGNDVENHKNLGFVDEDTLAELYSISDLFLMLSTQEAFGKTVIESLACKTPVLTVSDTGPDELTKVLNCNLSILNNNTNIELLGIIEASKNFDFNEIQHNIEKLFSLRSIAKLHYEYYSNL